MSSISQDIIDCPNCVSTNCTRQTGSVPIDRVELMCIDCGFYTMTGIFQMSLEEVNEHREEVNVSLTKDDVDWLAPLTELPELNKEKF